MPTASNSAHMKQALAHARTRREVLDQRAMRIMTAALAFILVLVGLHQVYSDRTTVRQLPVIAQSFVHIERDGRDGTIVRNVDTGATVQFDIGEGGFFEMLATVIAHQRRQHGIKEGDPLIARLHSPQHVTLLDPMTGKVFNLASYGETNINLIKTYLIEGEAN